LLSFHNQLVRKLFVDILNPERRHYLTLFAIVLIMVSLIWSRWLISFGMGILIGNAVLHKDVISHLKHFLKSKWLIAFSLIFFIYLLSGINSDESEQWLKHLRHKLPFLLLPFSFTAMKRITQKEFRFLLFVFLCICTLSVLPVLWEYFHAYAEINDSYLRAQVLPTPISHIRYSLLLTLAVISSVWIFLNAHGNTLYRYLSLGLGLFLFAFIHLLAVRSGLLALYLSLGFITLFFIIKEKKWWLAVAGTVVMIAVPVLAWYALPTFQNKIKYAKWDMGIFNSDKDRSQYSDSRRLFSWQVALDIFYEKPLLGSGIGDLRSEMDKTYRELRPNLKAEDRIMPHNQWLYILAGTGLLGLLLFLLSQLFIAFSYGLSKQWLYLAFLIVLTSSFIAEATLEAQLGVGIYCLFVLLLAQYFIPDKVSFSPEL